jgi:hypothetical protein
LIVSTPIIGKDSFANGAILLFNVEINNVHRGVLVAEIATPEDLPHLD